MKSLIHVRTFDEESCAACERVQLVRRRAATDDEHDAPNKRRVRAVRDGLLLQGQVACRAMSFCKPNDNVTCTAQLLADAFDRVKSARFSATASCRASRRAKCAARRRRS